MVKYGTKLSFLSLLVLISILVTLPDRCQASPNTADNWIHIGQKYEEKKDEETSHDKEAIAAYTEAIKLDPMKSQAYWHRGRLFYEEKHYQAAIADLTKAINYEKKPDELTYWLRYWKRAECNVKLSKYKAAIEDYSKALDINYARKQTQSTLGDIDMLLSERAAAYHAIKQYDCAIYDLNQVSIQRNIYYDRARVYYDTEKYELAIRDCDAAINIIGMIHKGKCLYLKAQSYEKLNKIPEAIHNYKRSISSSLPFDSLILDAKQRLVELGDAKEIKEPLFSDTDWEHITWSYVMQQKLELAKLSSTQAIMLNPNFAGHYQQRASILKLQGQYKLAIEDFTKAIELEGQSPITKEYAKVYSNRANLYNKIGKNDLAISDLTKTIEYYTNNEKYGAEYYLYRRGRSYYDMGKYQDAIEDFSKEIDLYQNRELKVYNPSLEPKNAITYYWRGQAYLKLGQYKVALADFNSARELNPKLAESYYYIGNTYEKMGQKAEAAKAYKQYLDNALPYDEFYAIAKQQIKYLINL